MDWNLMLILNRFSRLYLIPNPLKISKPCCLGILKKQRLSNKASTCFIERLLLYHPTAAEVREAARETIDFLG